MKLRKKVVLLFSSLFLFLLPVTNLICGGKGDDTPITSKLAVEGLTGMNLWLVNIYNDERWVFAIICTLSMAVVGASIAFVTDLLLKIFGLEVTKIQHHE